MSGPAIWSGNGEKSMKKTYEKPSVERRERLSAVTAVGPGSLGSV